MQFCFEPAIAGAVARRQRFVEDGDGMVGIARLRLGLSQRNLEKAVEHQNVLFAQEIDAATHVLEPAAWRAVRSGRPTLEKRGKRSKHSQVMLTREPGEFESALRGPYAVAAHQFEQRRMLSSKRERAGMRNGGELRLSAFEKGHRALDFAERP